MATEMPRWSREELIEYADACAALAVEQRAMGDIKSAEANEYLAKIYGTGEYVDGSETSPVRAYPKK